MARASTLCSLLVLLVAACGDDDAGPVAPTTTTTSTGGSGGEGMGGMGAAGGIGGAGGDDTTPPTGTAAPLDELRMNDAIVITFDETMDPESLVLGGSLADMSDGGTWSSERFDNDTLTIAPAAYWELGEQSLTVDASDPAGNAASVEESYTVRLVFAPFQAASVVIGQTDFTGGMVDQGGPAGAGTLDSPQGAVAYDAASDTLFVGDPGNGRVLGFAGIPTSNGALASFVLGQNDFATTTGGTSETALDSPEHATVLGGKLFVTEYSSSRLSIYDPVPTSGPGTISVVVGQPNKTSSTLSCTATGLGGNDGHYVTPQGKLIVTDGTNHRVLVYNSIPTSDGAVADLVLGQNSFTTCASDDDDQDGTPDSTPSARTLDYPAGAWSDDDRLVVLDVYNNRVLIWTTFPSENFQPADLVLGQSDFTSSAANADGAPTAATLNDPYLGIWSNGTYLIVTDAGNHRVLIWDSFPTTSFQPADQVLGQSDFAHNTPNDDDQDGTQDATPSARAGNYPDGVLLVGDKLFVSEWDNHRVLIFEAL